MGREKIGEMVRNDKFHEFLFSFQSNKFSDLNLASYVLYIRGGVDRHASLFKFVICVHLLFYINIVLPIDLLALRFGVVRCVENNLKV